MAQIPNQVSSIIELFLEELKRNHINIEQAILFGSYAHGTYTPWSDIDLALVSPDFEGDRFKDRDKIRRIKLKISSSLEPIPYPPNAFTADDPFVEQILTTGINVMSNISRKTS
jgi:predicted nucleotidyltransferase